MSSRLHEAYPRRWQSRSGVSERVAPAPITRAQMREINAAFSSREQQRVLAPSTLVITRRAKQ